MENDFFVSHEGGRGTLGFHICRFILQLENLIHLDTELFGGNFLAIGVENPLCDISLRFELSDGDCEVVAVLFDIAQVAQEVNQFFIVQFFEPTFGQPL